MKIKEFKEEAKNEAIKLLSSSVGLVVGIIIISIGIQLVIGEIWIGVILIILGYEVIRYVFKYIFKYVYLDLPMRKLLNIGDKRK